MGFPAPPQKIIPFKRASIPPQDLERQFEEQNRAISRLIEFLRTIVRDDGKLRNGLIEPEQLGDETPRALARGVVAEVESLLEDVRSVSREAMLASGEARSLVAQMHERELQIRSAAQSMQLASEQVRERLLALQTATPPPSSPAATPALPTGVLGPNVGGPFGTDPAGASATAQDWAQVSIEWAEHMPDNLPGNILALTEVTGEHWSSRWWANKSANAFGMLAWWYQGAFPSPGPPTTPYTATGDPLMTGAMYYDTTLGTMMVWNGSTWVSSAAPQKAATSSLYYSATNNQTVFPLDAIDNFGKNFTYDQTNPEGTMVYVNGVRLEPQTDFAIDIPTSTITMERPVSQDSVVTFDLLVPAQRLAPSGSADTYLLAPIIPDGTTTVFSGLKVAANNEPVTAIKNEEVFVWVDSVQQAPGAQYSVNGDTITFAEAPPADSVVFMVWFGPSTEGGGAVGVYQVIGYSKGVNWGLVQDIPVALASTKCLPISVLNTNFNAPGNGDGTASLYTGPNRSGNNFGGVVGSYIGCGGVYGADATQGALLNNINGSIAYLSDLYINISIADSGTPTPLLSDVYIIGIDLEAIAP